ncbi:hypothetical protein Bca52824_035891 [Brassica carinata]|uniref:Uncharacterized protein n=1 Tax=Brassica carinata TaxID=52824 RepID=A0A8X7S2Z1_BRACI|nr:hypothetical protein Bca52824_035891 [Brassica carinata]
MFVDDDEERLDRLIRKPLVPDLKEEEDYYEGDDIKGFYEEVLTKENIAEPMRNIRRALLEAYVSLPVVRSLVMEVLMVRKKNMGKEKFHINIVVIDKRVIERFEKEAAEMNTRWSDPLRKADHELPSRPYFSPLVATFSVTLLSSLFHRISSRFPARKHLLLLFLLGHVADTTASLDIRRMQRLIHAMSIRLLGTRGHYTIDLVAGVAAAIYFESLAGERDNCR